jgi:hypothetical protein
MNTVTMAKNLILKKMKIKQTLFALQNITKLSLFWKNKTKSLIQILIKIACQLIVLMF